MRSSTAELRLRQQRPLSTTEEPGRGREGRPGPGEDRCRDNPTQTQAEGKEGAAEEAEEIAGEAEGRAGEEEEEEGGRVVASEAMTAAMRVIRGRGPSLKRRTPSAATAGWRL